MSKLTYSGEGPGNRKPLVWLRSEVKTPPLSRRARVELGYRLRLLQEGITLAMPYSRPMKSIGKSCHELRVKDAGVNWRLVIRVDSDAIVVAGLFRKTAPQATRRLIVACRRRLSEYDAAAKG
jgi:phage-related protein